MAGKDEALSGEGLVERLLPEATSCADVGGGGGGGKKWKKTYLDVLGVCCSAEVALVERLLAPLDGVRVVSVVVASRTVVVEHDPAAASESAIVNALNKAGLEASMRAYGSSGVVSRWPSPYIVASGVLLLASFFNWLFPPLQLLAFAAVCAGAPPMLRRGWAAACSLSLDINVLMLIAVAGALALGDYTEAGGIVFLFTTAEWLETLACTKASAGMSSLMGTLPAKAVLVNGEVVRVRDVRVGDVVAVRAGEIVPVDGVVVDGQSEVDESSLTGESFPVPKQPHSDVWAGTMNMDGYIAVRTTAVADNSTVARMDRLVEAAQNSRSKTQRLIDICAKYYTPAVVVAAAGVPMIPALLGADSLRQWWNLALVLLVSACPCALVLSTPVATFCAMLRAARMGIFIKGGDVLESLGEIRAVAFDKTGTITRGEFSIDSFHLVENKLEIDHLLHWVASIESKSSHPMAAALVEYAQSKSIQPNPENVGDFRIYPGEGIYGEIHGKHIYIGNRRALARASSPQQVQETSGMIKGVSVGYVICDGELAGVFSLSDDCRTGAAEAVRELGSLGIKSVMLTGDSTRAAMHAQGQLGGVMEELHSELLPEDKVRLVGGLKARFGPTMMVGDGMNDAAALAAADVGVSMGISGSAAAMETSHATLMSSDVLRVPEAIRLGRRARRIIAVNVAASLAVKAAVLVLAASWRPVLWAAVLADVGTCLLVVLNSMTLLREKWKGGKKGDACRATARSLAMRSQLAADAGAPNSTAAGAGREQTNGCHCCPKPSKSPEHSVVIDIPSNGEHKEEQPTMAAIVAKCCGGGESKKPAASRASQGCCSAGEGKPINGTGRRCTNEKPSCCDKGAADVTNSSPETAKGCANEGCCASLQD
ncbi:cadmium/zinc-transporting ATPase HMA3-like [Oryza brachyantha]|uniref:cadmium/zinc-transporting ATPase HMA3-like n=1 Tax=Oryza brachyantha TaxID=4533 RepID=UPI001ADD48DB|nr:cadmium/zinc-transporting ATPase HMA3-like [Oryza brachyantha]